MHLCDMNPLEGRCVALQRSYCQGDGAQHAGPPAERRRDNVCVNFFQYGRRLDIAVQGSYRFLSDERHQLWLLGHTTANDNPLRREGANKASQGQGNIVRLQFPGRMIGRQGFCLLPPALLHSGAGSQPFETIAMKRAVAFEGVKRFIVRERDVSHFGVQQAVRKLPVDQRPTADACADCQVDEGIQSLGSAPAPLSQRRASSDDRG